MKRIKDKCFSKINSSDGYIALTSVIVLGALILVIGISAIITSTREVDTSKLYKDSRQALASANSCAEVGIAELIKDGGYQGRQRISVGDYACNILSVSAITGGKTFDTVGRASDSEKRLRVQVMDDNSFSINIAD
jgi:hypothetical protein